MTQHADIPPLPLAAAYFGSALGFLVCGAAGLIWVAPLLAQGAFPVPAAIAVTHLFTLGWITLSIMGALHHFVAVALHVRLMSTRGAVLQLAAFISGLIGFTAGELLGLRFLLVAGAGLVALVLLVFSLRLVLALWRAHPGRTVRALLGAGAFLVVTACFGLLLAAEPVVGWLGERRLPLVALHVHVALVGWVLLTVVAVAQRLLPMFLLTRAPSARLGSGSLVLLATGVLALLLLAGTGHPLRIWLPLSLVAAGLALFLWQAGRVYSRPGVPELDAGMRFAGVGLVYLGIALVVAPFALRLGLADPQRLVLYLAAAILAALVLFVSGNYYRIIPFLVWSHRFGELGPRAGVPGPSALYRGDVAALALLCCVTGATTLLVAVGHGTRPAAQAGAVAFAVGVLLVTAQLTAVLRRRPD